MSLYGDGDVYNVGAIENAMLAPVIYPGWQLRIYVDPNATATEELAKCGVDVYRMPASNGHEGMFWRFLPAGERDVDAVIVRDCDSRLLQREASAVAEWLESGRRAHVMRDHEHHVNRPMLGGMWGVRGGVVPDMAERIAAWPDKVTRVQDMVFLEREIWPLIAHDCVCHCSVAGGRVGGVPFPAGPVVDVHVGQQIAV